MNKLKLFFRAIKRAVSQEAYSSPKDAVRLYRKKGVVIGENTELYNTSIDGLRPFLVEIGDNTLITGAKILTHDASTKKALGYTKLGRVKIGNNVFVGLGTVILPGVTIGNNVIVGAATVVSKDIPDGSIVVGNPMRIVGSYDDNVRRNAEKIATNPIFAINYNMTDEEKADMKDKLDGVIGYAAVDEELRRLGK